MFDKLSELEAKYDELSARLSDGVNTGQNLRRELAIEHAGLSDIVAVYREYKQAVLRTDEAKEMLSAENDYEFRQLLKDELKESAEAVSCLSEQLKGLLLPKDKNDEKNVIVEIRGGAGGEEAALFAGVLFRMYSRFAERTRWKTEILNSNASDLGGFKEIVFLINGKAAYSRLKYESGVHRVQRIPTTESGGRIHTSTVTVAVLPEADDVDMRLDQNEIRVDVFRSSGNGGQSVNTTDSAVRVTHIPTGIVISCQDEKSQLKNKDKALKILRAKLYELELEKQKQSVAAARRSQVGTGDRSERIRTYNFPQGRVTDHRVNLTLHRLDDVLDGDLTEITDALITTDRAEKLQSA